MKMKKILFDCLGNICRSPAAEAIMKKKVEARQLEHLFEIDSAGIMNYHDGELPDDRMRKYGSLRGYKVDSIARQITKEDFEYFDIIVGMDNQNIADLKRKAPNKEALKKIQKIDAYFTKHDFTFVPDPYYGNEKDFNFVLDLLEDACENIVNQHLQ